MLKRSHTILGATAGLVTAQATGEPLAGGAVVGAVCGLLPDIDSPGSALGRFFPRFWHRLTPGHRGPTHSLVWCALVGLVVSYWSDPLALLAMAGVASHLISDGLTESGVPWLWPLSRHRFRLPRWLAIKTRGGWSEKLTVGVLLAGAGWWMVTTQGGI